VRTFLNRLYDAAGALAAVFMLLLLVMVLLSVLGRQLHFHVPGTDAYAGYAMAAAGFFALAHTFKRGEHIRVTLLMVRLPGRTGRALEIWALFASSLLACLAAFYAGKLAYQSYTFNDISTSNDATPLWIPQLSMALGSAVFAIALIDEFVLSLQGKSGMHVATESLHNE
jgi:TRAP-type C4-dicarboxylate transport system permease small subunit